MTRRIRMILGTLVAMAAAVAPLHADLRYTMKIDAPASTAPAAAPASPLMAQLGRSIAGVLAPEGGLEVTVTIGEQGSRVEYSKAYTVVPAGGSTLMRPDGSIIVIDPSTKTFWRMDRPQLPEGIPGPEVTVTRTGETAVVAGVPTERATLTIRVPLRAPAGTNVPAGMPTELQMSGEAWLADRYASYARMSAGLSGMTGFGLEKIAAEGLPMRSILRSEMFGDRQIESTVTGISEITAPAGTFEVPAGYSEVPPPATLPGLAHRPQ